MPVKSNIVTAGKHVGPVESSVQTVKEGSRYHVHRLPYKRYPKVMVK